MSIITFEPSTQMRKKRIKRNNSISSFKNITMMNAIKNAKEDKKKADSRNSSVETGQSMTTPKNQVNNKNLFKDYKFSLATKSEHKDSEAVSKQQIDSPMKMADGDDMPQPTFQKPSPIKMTTQAPKFELAYNEREESEGIIVKDDGEHADDEAEKQIIDLLVSQPEKPIDNALEQEIHELKDQDEKIKEKESIPIVQPSDVQENPTPMSTKKKAINKKEIHDIVVQLWEKYDTDESGMVDKIEAKNFVNEALGLQGKADDLNVHQFNYYFDQVDKL